MPARFYDYYQKPDILAALSKMYSLAPLSEGYSSHCCYCESQIGVTGYPHIEHRKPKRKYPESAYEWNNLHLACGKCNNAKGDKFNEANEILDACVDTIGEHLSYRLVGLYLERWPISHRGATTVKHTKLNDMKREELLRARTVVFHDAFQTTLNIKNNADAPDAGERMAGLLELTKGQFGSVVRHAMIVAGILPDTGATSTDLHG